MAGASRRSALRIRLIRRCRGRSTRGWQQPPTTPAESPTPGSAVWRFGSVPPRRRTGKSFPMVPPAARMREAGAVVLDLTAIGRSLTPEQWYDGLLARLGQQLELEDESWTTSGSITSDCGRCSAG